MYENTTTINGNWKVQKIVCGILTFYILKPTKGRRGYRIRSTWNAKQRPQKIARRGLGKRKGGQGKRGRGTGPGGGPSRGKELGAKKGKDRN